MSTCSRCLINSNYPGISFNTAGECSLCNRYGGFKPIGEDKLRALFQQVRQNRKSEYDALVPLSGGKDSTYILHLAVNVYQLKVLAMTYDNGLFSQIARDNIDRAIRKTGVPHIMCRPDPEILKKIYRTTLTASGDICGACDIGTKSNIFKVACDNQAPMILYGTSPLEEDSFVPDSIQDVARMKYILKHSSDLTKREIDDFLIFPHLNHFRIFFNKRTGKFPKEVSPLFYLENPTDKEMGEIITREMDWVEDTSREYSKHFDCFAEPLTNYIRNRIYGYERHICQYSNMIRRGEITRGKAMELYAADNIAEKPDGYRRTLDYLGLTDQDLEEIIRIKPLKFEGHTSRMNRIFTKLLTAGKTLRLTGS